MVTSSYPKRQGDVTAPFIDSIVRGVAARGHRVDVILPEHPDLDQPDGGSVRFLPYAYAPRRAWTRWGYAQSLEADVKVRKGVYLLAPLVALALRRAVSAQLSARRYDALHVHWVVPNAAMIADIAATHRIPTVVSLHGSDVFMAERFPPARMLARRALAGAGAVTACSGDLHRRALALGARPARTRTVPYGVDLEAFTPDIDRAAVRRRLEVPEGDLLVLSVGRLVEKKGFTHLVEAAARVKGIAVRIAGEGDLRAALTAQAQALSAPVRLVGNLERDLLVEATAAADIVVVPSIIDAAGNVDGLPNTLLEALGAGRAVVASRVAGIPDVVEDGVQGLLVAPGDAAALADALHRLAADETLRARLGEAARNTARERLTWAAAARAFEECYVQAATLDPR